MRRDKSVIHAGNKHLGVWGKHKVFKVIGLGEITKEVNVDRLKKRSWIRTETH